MLVCLVVSSPEVNAIVPVQSDHERVAIITGANTGIGLATATRLVVNHNVHVVLACRSRTKAEQAARMVPKRTARNSRTNSKHILLA